MPRARRPILLGAETSFRGKGATVLVCRPQSSRLGVFYAGCPPLYWPERCRCWGIRCKLAELGQRQRRSGPTRKHKATMPCSCGRMAYGSVRMSMQTNPCWSRRTIPLSASSGGEGGIGGKQNVVSSRGVASPIPHTSTGRWKCCQACMRSHIPTSKPLMGSFIYRRMCSQTRRRAHSPALQAMSSF